MSESKNRPLDTVQLVVATTFLSVGAKELLDIGIDLFYDWRKAVRQKKRQLRTKRRIW